MKGKVAIVMVLVAAMLWGTTGTMQTLLPEGVHPVAVGTARLAVGGIALTIIVLFVGKLNLKSWPIKPTILAALSMAAYQPFFFTAVTMTGVAIGTVVAIGSAPILSGLMEWLIWKRRPIRAWWLSTFLAIVGCLLLFLNQSSVYVDPLGLLLALGAGLSFAIYTIVSKDLVKSYSSISVVAVVFTLSAILLSPLLFVYDMTWITQLRGAAVSLHLGLIATALAYFMFAKGLVHVPSSTAVTLSLAEPLTAAFLGVFIVGEELSFISWIGVSMLLLGIGFLIKGTEKETPRMSEINQV
ncbi:EamA family transporter [Oceanobacillus kapialis]|uniref:EamA family transporter n=1 Tax=Oceanobacillus kapialis TaxID=481353 RepID=UPI00384D6AD4